MNESKLEAMRTNPDHWTLGVIYSCPKDPRLVVRQRFPIGWTWNFANPWVVPGMVIALVIFLGPVAFALYFEVRSAVILSALFLASLCALMLFAHWLSRDPTGRG